MEITQDNMLLYGSNYIDLHFYENGFLENFHKDKISIGENVLGLGSLSGLLETNQNEIYQSLHTKKTEIDCTYSLNDLVDLEATPTLSDSLNNIYDTCVLSPESSNVSSYEILDTLVSSPLSLNDDASFCDVISVVSLDNVLQDCTITPENMQESLFKEASTPLSVDSGFSSEDDPSCTQFMLQLFGSEKLPISQSIPESGHLLNHQILQFIEDIDNEENPKLKAETYTNSSDININNTGIDGVMPAENMMTVPRVNELKTLFVQTQYCDVKEESKAGKIKTHPSKKKMRTPEQKLRKKAQNRNAASRYREKKKDELGSIFVGAAELEEQNSALKEKVSGLEKEIEYLKELMMDVLKARVSKGNISHQCIKT